MIAGWATKVVAILWTVANAMIPPYYPGEDAGGTMEPGMKINYCEHEIVSGDEGAFLEYEDLWNRLDDIVESAGVSQDDTFQLYEALLGDVTGKKVLSPYCSTCKVLSPEPIVLKEMGFSELASGKPGAALDAFERMRENYSSTDFDIYVGDCDVDDITVLQAGPYGLIYQAEVFSKYSLNRRTGEWSEGPEYEGQFSAYFRLMEEYGYSDYRCYMDGCIMFFDHSGDVVKQLLRELDDIVLAEYWVVKMATMLKEAGSVPVGEGVGGRDHVYVKAYPIKIAFELKLLLAQKYIESGYELKALKLFNEIASEGAKQNPVYSQECLYCYSCDFFQLAALCEMMEIAEGKDFPDFHYADLLSQYEIEYQRSIDNDFNIDDYVYEDWCMPALKSFGEYLEKDLPCPRQIEGTAEWK